VVGRKLRHVEGQTELDLFQNQPAEGNDQSTAADLLTLVMQGHTNRAYRELLNLSSDQRYRIRVACRILILEAAKPDRIHPS
jgi:hypothetical protein